MAEHRCRLCTANDVNGVVERRFNLHQSRKRSRIFFMRPSKFIATQERRLGRSLTAIEVDAVNVARALATGKRASIKAMRAALEAPTPPLVAVEAP